MRVGVDRTIDCDEPLCGYRDWIALCQAVRNVGVHFTSSCATMVTVVCSLLLTIIFLVLEGSDRISHKKGGTLDLQRLVAKVQAANLTAPGASVRTRRGLCHAVVHVVVLR